MRYIGVDIGGTKCAITLGDETSRILKKVQFDTSSVHETLEQIVSGVQALLPCEAVGISCGGPLDVREGVILSPPNLPGWDKIPIVQILRERLEVKAYLQNDADACALAEWKFGSGVGTKNMIFCTFGTGMGLGLILNSKLYTGACNMAGEFGHVRMAEYGPIGYGKAGSFEGFCSGSGIAQIGASVARELLQQGKTCSFCRSIKHIANISAKEIAKCAKSGEKDALEVYRVSGAMLGNGLAVLIDLLNPERIVLGSIYARSGELLQEAMYAQLQKECLPGSLAACQIVPASLGEYLGDVAALSVAMNGRNWE